MSTASQATESASLTAQAQTPPPDPQLPRWLWPLGVTVLSFLYALVPATVGSHGFYRRGDSASQFIPTWAHLGDLLRDGTWPP